MHLLSTNERPTYVPLLFSICQLQQIQFFFPPNSIKPCSQLVLVLNSVLLRMIPTLVRSYVFLALAYLLALPGTLSPTSSCSYIKLIEGNGRYLNLPGHDLTNGSSLLGSMERNVAEPSVSLDDQASMDVNFDPEDLIGRTGKKQ